MRIRGILGLFSIGFVGFLLLIAAYEIANNDPPFDYLNEGSVAALAAPIRARVIAGRLDNTSMEKQLKILEELGRMGPRAASTVATVAHLVESTSPQVQQEALRTLAQIGKPAAEALPVIIRALLRDPTVDGFGRAGDAIRSIGADPVVFANVVVTALKGMQKLPSAERISFDDIYIVAIAVQAINGHDQRVREVGVDLMQHVHGYCVTDTFEPFLVKLLADRDVVVRRRTVQIMGRAGKPCRKVSKMLVERLSDPDPETRALAVQSLGQAAESVDPDAITILVKKLTTGDSASRREAALALAHIHAAPERVEPILLELLNSTRPGERIPIFHALEALPCRSQSALRTLTTIIKKSCRSGVESEYEAAITALTRSSGDVTEFVDFVTEAMREDPPKCAMGPLIESLGSLNSRAKKAVPVLTGLLVQFTPGHWTTPYRRKIVNSLGMMGSAASSSKEVLEKLSRDADPEIRNLALWALRQIRGELGPDHPR